MGRRITVPECRFFEDALDNNNAHSSGSRPWLWQGYGRCCRVVDTDTGDRWRGSGARTSWAVKLEDVVVAAQCRHRVTTLFLVEHGYSV